MKIRDLSVRLVAVPLKAPLRWSMGVISSTVRALVTVRTDDGIEGVGETTGGPHVAQAVGLVEELLVGLDPLEVGVLQHRLGVFRGGYEQPVPAGVRSAIEMACLDAAGKALERPVCSLIGGAVRDEVEVAAYLLYRYPSEDGRVRGESTPEEIADRATELVGEHGFRVVKLKGGVFPPEEELAALELLRERFPEARLRWDPNAAWSLPTSLSVIDRLRAEGLALEYLEDPTAGIEAMAQVRARTSMPLATNMCVVRYEHLAPALRLGAVDVILAGVHYWGGLLENQKMMAVCEAFGLGVGMHSDRELGVSTAAMIHLAAAAPSLTYAIDSHVPDLDGDVVAEPFVIREGRFGVPRGPGLGVELDPQAVEHFGRLYDEIGSDRKLYDPARPGWVPATPLF